MCLEAVFLAQAVLTGQVVEAGTGQPIPGAIVRLSAGEFQRRVVASDEGRFVLVGVPPGSYQLRAGKPGFLDGGFGQRSAVDTAKRLTIAPGESAAHTLRLWRKGVISGRVIDQVGEPQIGVSVGALAFVEVGPQFALREVAVDETDDRGEYRLAVPPGDYLVAVTPSRTRHKDPRGEPSHLDVDIPTTFHPVGTAVASASVLAVGSNQTIGAVDIMVAPRVGVTVAGRVVGEAALSSVQVRVVEAANSVLPPNYARPPIILSADNSFEIAHVHPGDYVLSAVSRAPASGRVSFGDWSDQGFLILGNVLPGQPLPKFPDFPVQWARAELSVSDEPLKGLELRLQPGIEVRGDLSFKGASKRPTAQQMTASVVALEPVNGLSEEGGFARVEEDGTFALPQMLGGRYRVRLFTAFRQWHLTELRLDSLRSGMEIGLVAATAELSLSLSDAPLGGLVGIVADVDGKPVPFATVYVFDGPPFGGGPTGALTQGSAVGTDQHGAFAFPSLRPGSYILAALEEHRPAWKRGGQTIDLRRRGVRVDLRSGETTTQNIVLRLN